MNKHINVLIPAMGKSLFFQEAFFPKPMIDVDGQTMLEKVVENFGTLAHPYFVFVFDQKDCTEFHLDEAARILTAPESTVLCLEHPTAGALCTSLMAVDSIGTDDPLIIANCDQVIDIDYQAFVDAMEQADAAAGVITFPSIHPRWSYVRLDSAGDVVEVAEKRPLSKNAIAGCYYFRHGNKFIEAAKRVILKDNQQGGQFYLSASLNEIILMGGRVAAYPIHRYAYHSFYSPDKIKEYESSLRGKHHES